MENINFISSIESLLLEHNCVIISNFGGFVINAKEFEYNEKEAMIYPSSKSIAFNERLKSDDGILAMHLAQQNAISQKKAFELVAHFAKEMKDELKNMHRLNFGNLGTFSLTEEFKMVFEPNQTFNYDLKQFGLYPVSTGARKKPVLAETTVEKSLKDLPMQIKVDNKEVEEPKKITSKFYAYLTAAFLVGGIGAYILTEPNSKFVNSSFSPLTIKIKKEVKHEKLIRNKEDLIQPKINSIDVSVVSKSSNEVEEKTEISSKKTENLNPIFLVAASFKTLVKAELGKTELIQKGFRNVSILPKLENEAYFRISLGKVENMDVAYSEAAILKKEKKIDIWVLKRD